MKSKYLVINGLTKDFGSFRALNNISIDIKEGEFVCFLGPSGCGKTTLLRCIAGLELQSCGTIFQNGELISQLPTSQRDFGIVFQSYALFPNLTCFDNIAYGLQNLRWKKSDVAERVNELLSLIGLSDHSTKFPSQLSGGEQQRVALARSIAVQPKLLLLDEPFSDLDINLKREIIDDTLHLINSLESSALVVTHNAEEAMFLSDMIIVMDKGKIVQIGTPHEIYFHPVNLYVASLFGETNIFQTTVKNKKCDTPLGSIEVNNFQDNQSVNVVIRPEAIKLSQEKSPLLNPNTGVVVDSKFLGNSAIIHMTVNDQLNKKHHIHSKVIGNFLPPPASSVSITLDQSHIFVFPR